MRTVDAVRHLSGGRAGEFVEITDVSAWLEEHHPAIFPRPLRGIRHLCREAADAGLLLEQPDPPRARPDWSDFRYALREAG